MASVSAPPAAIVIRLPAGASTRAVWVERPAGVVLLTRISVPHGTQVNASMIIPTVAGVAVDTRDARPNRCRVGRTRDVCVRAQEWCPMPRARWRLRIAKRSGPAGTVRVEFRVGVPA
jgi:hypothetical protein